MKRQSPRRADGFTIIELAVVLALMMIIAMMGAPALLNLATRTRMEGTARETTMMVQRARMEAVRSNRSAVVEFDFSAPHKIWAFLDFDGDGEYAPTPGGDPRRDDYVILQHPLPTRAALWGQPDSAPGGDNAILGFSEIDGVEKLIVQPDGSLAAAGSISIGDAKENFMRVDVSRTAKTELFKWNKDTAAWVSQENAGEWEWY